MSTILKALRRLEGERRMAREGRALREEIVALRPGEVAAPRPARTFWWVGGVGLLLVALMVGGLLWLRERPAARAPAPVARVEPAAPAPEPARAAPEPPAAAPEPAPAPPADRAPPIEIAAAPSPPAPAPDAPVLAGRPYRFPDPEPTPAFDAPPTRIAPASEAAAVAVEPDVPPPPPREPRAGAAQPARPPAPAARVERTVWHPDPTRRLAVVRAPGGGAPVTLREGDALGDLVVRRVEPSGVVFLYRGEELRVFVGGGS